MVSGGEGAKEAMGSRAMRDKLGTAVLERRRAVNEGLLKHRLLAGLHREIEVIWLAVIMLRDVR